MTMFGSQWFANTGGAVYEIDQSIRFNSADSAYLEKTYSSSESTLTAWSFSTWVKRSKLGAEQFVFQAGTTSANLEYLRFTSSDKLEYKLILSSSVDANYITSQLFRDPGAWMHIYVYRSSTTFKLYINGSEVTDFSTSNAPGSSNGMLGSNVRHRIAGDYSSTPANLFGAYLAEMNFVPGTAKAVTDFGETNADTGQWVPVQYTGSYGSNGFYITGEDSTFLGQDVRTSGDQVNSFQSSQYTGATSDYTFSDGQVEANTANRAIRTVDTFTGDFEFTWRYVNMANFVIGLYEIDEDATFSSTSSAGNMQNMTDSWYVQTSSVASNRDIKYGGTTVVESTTIANGDTWKMTRESGTIKVYRNGSLVHTFTQTSTNEVRLVIAQGDSAADANQIAWVDNSTLGNNFFSSGLATTDQRLDSPTLNKATLNGVNLYTTGSVLSDGNLTVTNSGTSGFWRRAYATQALSYKTYWEVHADNLGSLNMGLSSLKNPNGGINNPVGNFGAGIQNNEAFVAGSYANESGGSRTFPISTGNYVMFAFDPDRGALWAGTEGTWKDGTASSASSATILAEIEGTGTSYALFTGIDADDAIPHIAQYSTSTATARFSSEDWEGTAPTGYEQLAPSSLPDPTIALPEKYFNTVLYEGNGGGQRVGGFQPITETYSVPNSVIFNDNDSAYLTRTPASDGNRQTMTFSWWMKRGNLNITDCRIFTARDSNDDQINFRDASDYNRLDVFFDGTSGGRLSTSRAFDDSSTWNHCVVAIDTTQATSGDRVKIYINGVRVTEFDTETQPSLNKNLNGFNNNGAHAIGARAWSGAAGFYDGYLAEIYFIDGQQLDASSFGQLDASTNRWIPKDASGLTFGTNGYYLDMETAPGTGSGAGTDSSGNGNNFTESGLAAADQVTDSPTKNFCTLNPNDSYGSGLTLSNGNLRAVPSAAAYCNNHGTIYVGSGKWVYEVKHTTVFGEAVGWSPLGETIDGSSHRGWFMFANGNAYINTTNQGTLGTSLSSGDYRYIFYDADKKAMWFAHCDVSSGTPTTLVYENGATKAEIESGDTSNAVFTGIDPVDLAPGIWMDTSGVIETNFGQSSFYTTSDLPTGFNTLNNDNLPLSNGDLSAFVWIKNRDATDNHMLFDAVRGVTKDVHSNSTAAEVTNANTLTRFLKNGFEVGNDAEVNTSAESYVAWQWLNDSLTTSSNTDGDITSTVLANTASGVSALTYSGNGSDNQTIGHGLGIPPKMIFSKRTDTTGNWTMYHDAVGINKVMYLNLSNLPASNTEQYRAVPTSSVYTVGVGGDINNSSGTYVAYCFAEVDGFSKAGSYVANASTDGPFVYCGFRPSWVIFFSIAGSGAGRWMLDTVRSPFNVADDIVQANTSTAESSGSSYRLDFLSNGFKVRTSSDFNSSGRTIAFMAFAESPFKTATAR